MRWPTHLLTVDFETFWSKDYTLKKLSTEEYVRSPLFHAHGAAVKYGSAPSRWIIGADLPAFFAAVPWDDVALLAQNTAFDGLILAHHYGKVPALYLDTLSMARAALPRQRHSLEKLAEHFNLPAKGTAVNLTKGVRHLTDDIERQLGAYACHDDDLAYEVFQRLFPQIPLAEFIVIDLTIRMFTQPRLTLDKPKARKLLANTIRGKRSALQRLGVTKKDLASTDKFAAILEERFGIEIETKVGKKGPIPALAKTDQFMKALLEHENPDVQALAATRLSVKSTLEETRLRRLLAMHERGPSPVFLNYCGAHTLRWSGGDKVNWQNFTRGSELRKSVRAPEGHVLVVADLSQIEARVLNTLAEQWDMVELFEKGDPYCAMATDVYKRAITKKENPNERHVGKVLVLGCGYGMGAPKLKNTLRQGALGGPPIYVELETAEGYVSAYRKRHAKVVDYWRQAETVLGLLEARVEGQPWGPMLIDKGYIRHVASGVSLDYTGLVRIDGEWRMNNRDGTPMRNSSGNLVRLYGAHATENVVQWLSRVILAEAMVSMAKAGVLWRFPMVMTTHDEIVLLAPKTQADECLSLILKHMTKRPSWLPALPLAAEGGYDECYSK